MDVDQFFEALVELMTELDEEEKRHAEENLTEEELALFDLLTRPPDKLAKKDKDLVKMVARNLLRTLKEEKLVLDWRKTQQTRAAVRQAIEMELDELPDVYTKGLYNQKCELVYQHIYESYWGRNQSVYA
jgi:type I restriction enzyme R subunit